MPLETMTANAAALAYKDPRAFAKELAARARLEQKARELEAATEQRKALELEVDRRKLAEDFSAFRLRMVIGFIFSQAAVVALVLALDPELKWYANIITGIVIFQIGSKLIGEW